MKKICEQCNHEFSAYANKLKFCSRRCCALTRVGVKSPLSLEQRKEIAVKRLITMRKRNNFNRPFGDKNPMKNFETREKVRIKKIGKHHSKEHKQKMSDALKGKSYEELMGKEKADKLKELKSFQNSLEKNPAWLGGIAKEKNDKYFNKAFKIAVRQRDNYVCMVCGVHNEKLNKTLDVHHINYNKYETYPENCVSLCHSCHQKTNHNRRHWFSFLKKIMEERYNYQYTDNIKVIKFKDKEVKYENQ